MLKPVDTWLDYQTLFTGHLEAINLSPTTIRTYNVALDQLSAFLRPSGVISPFSVTRDHMTDWIRYLQSAKPAGRGLKPASVAQRYRSIQAFFKFMVVVEGMETSPLAKLPQPKVPELDVPVISERDLNRLFELLGGRTFDDRRDRAIASMLLDTGLRLAEIAGLTVDDVDLDTLEVTALGKGRRPRTVAFIKQTKLDLQRYILERRNHVHADEPALWLGRRGPMKASGIHQMLERRSEQAGIPKVHAHQFRHSNAHYYRLNGGSEGDLMRNMGWRAPAMAARYGRSAAAERARAAHPKYSPRHLVK